jgi:hypothetical protein
VQTLDQLVLTGTTQGRRISGQANMPWCVPVLISGMMQIAFKDKPPAGWRNVPTTSNASEAINADIKRSGDAAFASQCLIFIPHVRAAGGKKKATLMQTVAHCFMYCVRVRNDMEYAAKGGQLRYETGTTPQRKPRARSSSIKPKTKAKRVRSASQESGNGRRKKRVRFESDARGPDTAEQLDGVDLDE